MKYGCASPTPASEDVPRRCSESSDTSFEIVSAETELDAENQVSSSFKPSVTFHDIFDVYPMDADIIARVSYGEGFQTSPEDTVIVLPLAWTSVDQAACISKLSGNYVKFDVTDLPKASVDQFYQLCYCTAADKNVVGVSTPFFFREVHEEELMEFQKEQNKEFWTFRSRFAVLTDLYWNSLKKNIESCNETPPPDVTSTSLLQKLLDSSTNSVLNVTLEKVVESPTTAATVDVHFDISENREPTAPLNTSFLQDLELQGALLDGAANSTSPAGNSEVSDKNVANKTGVENVKLDDEILENVEAILALRIDENSERWRKIVAEKDDFYKGKIDGMQKQLDHNMIRINHLKTELDRSNKTSDLVIRRQIQHYKNLLATKETMYHDQVKQLEFVLEDDKVEIKRLKSELQKKIEFEENVSTKLVDQFQTIENLKNELAAYKKNMECRLKACAKQYTKLYLKLHEVENRASSD